MKKPLVTIIILNFNSLNDTIKCLQSIKRTTYQNFELLIVDNGSENNEGLLLQRKYGDKHKVLLLKKNLGYTGGNNFAFQKAKGKYIILLNNDTEVTPNWIDPLINLLEKNRSIAVVQPKIKMLQKKNYFDYAGAAGGFIDKYGYPFTKGRIFETQEKDTGQYDNAGVIFWASGACCAIRKSVIKEVGGLFDPIFFNYMEEIDFCWRVWNSGYKAYYCPESTIYHKGAASAGKNLYKKRYWEHRNNLILLYKNLNHNIVHNLIIRTILEIFTYLHYLFRGNFVYLKSLSFAHLDFLLMVMHRKIQRRSIKSSVGNQIPIFPSSIAAYYHLFKKMLFYKLEWSPVGNITYLIYNTKKSGGLKVIFEQANSFFDKGYFVKIIKIFGKTQSWFHLKMGIDDLRSILYQNCNWVVATFWPTAFFTFLFRKSKRLYFVQDWEESFYNNPIFKLLVRSTYNLPLSVITNNSFVAEKIKPHNKNIKVVKVCPVNTNVFFPNTKRPHKSKNKIINVVSVISWYNKHKGIDLIDKIIKNLKLLDTNYKFTLVSYEKYKYSDNFDVFVSNATPKKISNIYRQSDALLVASRNEGTLTTGLEAMACGCLVFTLDTPGVSNYAKHNYNAIVVKNIENFWKKNIIEKTLNNRILSERIKNNAFRTAKEYDSSRISDETELILHRS